MEEKAKTALVMEGGAMRGMFTCGVIDVMMENGIDFEAAAGISAGAAFGCNYKSRQIGRAIRYNKAYCKDPRYCSLRSLRKTGDLYGVDFCYRELPLELDVFDRATFAADPMEFYVGATDINTGEAVYHKCSDGGKADFEWMRASASMPLVSRIVEIDGRELLDGGIVDAVPYRFMESLGYSRNVIILTQPEGYRKKKSKALLPVRWKLRKYPKLVGAMADRHLMYNRQMDEIDGREHSGSAFVIRPPEPLNIGRTEKDPAELERVYRIGREEALRRLTELKAFLNDLRFCREGDILEININGDYLTVMITGDEFEAPSSPIKRVCPITDKSPVSENMKVDMDVYPYRVELSNMKTWGFVMCDNEFEIDLTEVNALYIESAPEGIVWEVSQCITSYNWPKDSEHFME